MRSFMTLTWMECKIYFRSPINIFFVLLFPTLLLLMFGLIFGNEPDPMYGSYGYVDAFAPSLAAIAIAISANMSLPISLTHYRERGILRRYRATPVSPAAILGSQLATHFVMTLIGMGLMVLVGALLFRMRFDGSPAAVLAGFSFSCLSFFALAMLLAGVLPNARVATVVGNLVLYPMVYLSGATIPAQMLPDAVRNVARFLPLTHTVTLLQGLWKGDAWSLHQTELVVLLAMMVVASIIAVRAFRWE